MGGALGTNVGAIAALKDKIAELERDNEGLAGENEEHAHIATIYLEKSGILWKDTAVAAWFRR